MSTPEMPIDRDEFRDAMTRIDHGLAGIHNRLDVLNGRAGRTETRLTVLETRLITIGGALGALWGVVQFVVGR